MLIRLLRALCLMVGGFWAALVYAAPSVSITGGTRHVVEPGQAVSLTVAATDSVALRYDWFRNGEYLAGANGPTLSVGNAQAADAGWYHVMVSPASGSGESTRSAPMFVIVAPTGSRVRTWGYSTLETRPPVNLTDVVALDSAYSGTLALRRDGSVVGWGSFNNSVPVPVGLTDVVAVSAGGNHQVALRSDGTVVVWSYANISSSLSIPAGLSNVVAIATSEYSVLALKSDGTVVTWGAYDISEVPAGLTGVAEIAVGDAHALARRTNGTVVAWGRNSVQQANVPVGLNGVRKIAAGGVHSVALKSDGTVVTWGNYGDDATPAGLGSVAGISAGFKHVLARKTDGTLVSWGSNYYGERTPPAELGFLREVSAGGYASVVLDDGNPPLVAPSISQQPSSVTAEVGQNVTLSVVSAGSSSTYRWQTARAELPDLWMDLGNDTFVSGAYTNTLLVKSVQYASSGTRYRCIVTNDAGVAISEVATVTVNVPLPILTSQTARAAANLNAYAYFNVTVDSPVAVSYRWEFKARGSSGWNLIANGDSGSPATSSSLVLTATLARHGAEVRCIATNGAGSVTSAPIVLIVNEAVTLSVDGQGRMSVPRGQSLTLTGAATSAINATLSYQWKKNNRPIAGATSLTLTLPGCEWADAGAYVLEVRDPFGGVKRVTRFVVVDVGPTQVVGWGANTKGQIVPPALLNNASALATGTSHTIVLKADGTVAGFGDNALTQISGAGSSNNFVSVSAYGDRSAALYGGGGYRLWGGGTGGAGSSDDNFIQIAAGGSKWIGLLNDGTVYARNWDWSAYPNPNPPEALQDVVAVAAGEFNFLALKLDGSVVSWRNSSGASAWDVVPSSVNQVKAIASGARHSLTLKTDGTVLAWGDNSAGQSNVPSNLTDVIAISASGYTSYALRANGSIVAWGRNTSGEATPPSGLIGVLAVTGGGAQALALRLATEDAAPVITTQPVALLRSVGASATFSVGVAGTGPFNYQWRFNGNSIAGATAASYTLPSVTLAADGDYDVVVSNHLGTTVSVRVRLAVTGATIPPTFSNTSPRRQIGALGEAVTFSVSAESANLPLTYQWKKNNRPISGANSASITLNNFTNDDVGAYTLVVTDSAGLKSYFTTFLLPHYELTQLRYWKGYPNSGPDFPAATNRLIDLAEPFGLTAEGTVVNWAGRSAIVGSIPANAVDLVSIKAGQGGLGLRADGTLVSWAINYTTPPTPPVDAVSLIAIDLGYGHALGLRSDGRVVAWGSNFVGQATVPAGLTDVVAIAAGSQHSLALKVDGTVVAWGNNNSGQAMVPAGLSGVVAISAGYSTSFAIKADGSVVAWGLNDYTAQTTVPSKALPARAIAADSSYVVAIKQDGTVVSWGHGGYGQEDVPSDINNVVRASPRWSYTMVLRDASTDALPIITQQPAGKTVAIGDAVILSVTASGPGPFQYQWRYNEQPIAGATSATFTLPSAQLADAGSYDVVVSNHRGGGLSQSVSVSVLVPPIITAGPSKLVNVVPGETLSLTVNATSPSAPLSYQWRKDNRVISGATNATYSQAAFAAVNEGVYTVEITDQRGLKTWGIYFVRPQLAHTKVIGWGSGLNSNTVLSTAPVVSLFGLYAVMRDGTVTYLGAGTPTWSAPMAMTQVVKLTLGLALKSDATVEFWPGYSATSLMPPVGLRDVVDLHTIGNTGAVALKADGSVVVWGGSSYGLTTLPEGLTNIVSLAAAHTHITAVRADGKVFRWGSVPGDSTTNPSDVALDGAIAVSANGFHSAALMPDSRVLVTGVLSGAMSSSISTDAIKLASGEWHLLALNAAGAVSSWGTTEYGLASVPVAALSNVHAIFANAYQSFAIRDASHDAAPSVAVPPISVTRVEGEIATFNVVANGSSPLSYQWRRDGVNLTGETSASLTVVAAGANTVVSYDVVISNPLGTITSAAATLTTRPRPAVSVQGANRRVLLPGEATTLSATASGQGTLRYQWLHNGRPISGATNASYTISAAVREDNGYYLVEVTDDYGSQRSSAQFVIVAPASTRVVAFGLNLSGQTATPGDLIDAVAVAAGGNYSLALKRDGTVQSWGNFSSAAPTDLNDVVAIAAGPTLSLALKSDGTVVSWGVATGVLGRLTDVVAISVSQNWALALKNDGTLFVWDATPEFNAYMRPPSTLRAVDMPTIGADYAIAIKPDGTLAAWGNSSSGLLNVPANLSSISRVVTGQVHALALKASGEVVAWGSSPAGQTSVPAGLEAIAVSAGGNHSLAIKRDGSVVAWGANAYGETTVPAGLTDALAISAGNFHSLVLREWVSEAPLIVGQPSMRSVFLPSVANFSVSATGPGVLGYQWQRLAAGASQWVNLTNGGAYNGVEGSLLSVVPTTLAMNGDKFRCVVSNSAGSVTSESAQLSVYPQQNTAPVLTFSLGSQDRVSQTLSIALQAADPDGDLSFVSLWVRTPSGDWLTIRSDGTVVAGQHFTLATAVTTRTSWVQVPFVFTAERGAGVYTIAAAAIDAVGQRADYSVDITVGPNRAPTGVFYLSGHRTLGETLEISVQPSDPDENYAFSNLRVYTPNRGWLTIRADNSIALTGEISAANNSSMVHGQTLRFPLSTTDGVGTYRFIFTVMDSVGERFDSAEQSVAVVAQLTAHEAWRVSYFNTQELANSSISGPNADPDGDGLVNLLEYALGLDPKVVNASGRPEVSASATEWIYTYTRPADRSDLAYVVESSADLNTWTSASVNHERISVSDGMETWRAKCPVVGTTNQFFRLKVTFP